MTEIDYYSDIPTVLLEKRRILDVGCGTGKNQLRSRHGKIFAEASKNGSYLGIDKEIQGEPLLNMIQEDIRDVVLCGRFDTVLLMHSLEHIPLKDWSLLFHKLKGSLTKHGWIIIACPYDEDPLLMRDSNHVVFNITLDKLQRFLPEVRLFKAGVRYPKRGSIKKAVWWFRKFFFGPRSVPLGLLRRSFIAFWKNDAIRILEEEIRETSDPRVLGQLYALLEKTKETEQ